MWETTKDFLRAVAVIALMAAALLTMAHYAFPPR